MGISDNLSRLSVKELKERRDVEALIKKISFGYGGCSDVCQALGEIGDKRAVAPLLEVLEKSKDVASKRYAVVALGQIGNEEAVSSLDRVLEDKGSKVELCCAAVSALSQIGGKRAISVLLKTLGDIRSTSNMPTPIWMPSALTVGDLAHHEIDRLGEQKLESLHAVLLDEDECGAAREAAVFLLSEIGEPSLGLISKALVDKDENVRKAARKVATTLEKRGFKILTKPSTLDTTMALEDRLVYLLDRYLPHKPEKMWYRQPNIPPKKLRNAISSYASGISADQVLALGDATIFGSAKKGLLMTPGKLYFNSGAKGEIAWSEIQEAKSLRGFGETGLEITPKSGDKVTVACDTFKGVRDDLGLLLNELAASS